MRSTRANHGLGLGGMVALLILALGSQASAHTTGELSEYGTATVNGVIAPAEYENSCLSGTQSAGATSYPITVCEQNTEQNDYYAVKVGDLTNDDDSVLLWFDNDHSGTVQTSGSQCTYGQPDEDSIGWFFGIFYDGYHCQASDGWWFGLDFTINGAGQKAFAPGQGWTFEFSHPLDSGDPDDYSLVPHDTIGWCLTYDDKSNSQPNNPGFAFGEIQFPPGCFVDFSTQTKGLVRGDATLLADVFKENAFDELLEKLKEKLKGLVAGCKFCPPDPRKALLERVNVAIKAVQSERKGKTLKALKQFKGIAKDLSSKKRKPLVKEAQGSIKLLKHSKAPTSRPTTPAPGGVHTGPIKVAPNGVPRG